VSKWKHEITESGGGNWEFEVYVNNRSNSFVKNSILYIKPTFTADWIGAIDRGSLDLWGGEPSDVCTGNQFGGCRREGSAENILPPIQSARLRTAETFALKYGRVEVRAKLPRGDWLWPAIWMLPLYNPYGNWPASGEIDIMESRGNANYPRALGGGVESFGSTLHWGPHYALNAWSLTHAEKWLPSGTFADAFHTYGLYWDHRGLYTYLDDPTNVVMSVNFTQSFWDLGDRLHHWKARGQDNPWEGATGPAPFDQKFFLIMNLAVGGTGGYFSDAAPNKPWKDSSPFAPRDFWNARNRWMPTWKGLDCALQVDSVRVWAIDGETDPNTAGYYR